MAKDVDLSSREWCDIVFEGKNKEFGAYVLRNDSPKRHTRAVVLVLIALAVILVALILAVTGVFEKAEDEASVSVVQETVTQYQAPEEEEEAPEEEMEEFDIPEPEPEEVIPEPQLQQQLLTQSVIKEDDQVTEELKAQDEIKEDEGFISDVNAEGILDLEAASQFVEEVVAEAPAPVEEEKVYTMAMVEQKPQFPGGEAAMYKWLGDNISYPAQASEEGVDGRVIVQFDVSKTGKIENVRIVRGRHPALDREATRLVKSMPDWQPGRNNGQPVKVTYTLPVTFKLQQ